MSWKSAGPRVNTHYHVSVSRCSPPPPFSHTQDMGAEYAKEQWAMEVLSHHFLPLIRYRRAKARRAGERFDPELAAPVR